MIARKGVAASIFRESFWACHALELQRLQKEEPHRIIIVIIIITISIILTITIV